MIVQETGDLRLQQAASCARVLEQPVLDVRRQIIPFAEKGGTQTFQDSAFHAFFSSAGPTATCRCRLDHLS